MSSAPNFRVTGLDLSAHMVKDAARAIAFYRDVLGMEPTRTYPDDAGAEYEFADGTAFGLWNPEGMMPFMPSGGNLFAVDDIDAAVNAVKARGLNVSPIHDTPVCRMAQMEDTEGNTITLHQRTVK